MGLEAGKLGLEGRDGNLKNTNMYVRIKCMNKQVQCSYLGNSVYNTASIKLGIVIFYSAICHIRPNVKLRIVSVPV